MRKIKTQLLQLRDKMREDITNIYEPKAQALLETSAEVLNGLAKAFDDYEKKSESAWQDQYSAGRLRG